MKKINLAAKNIAKYVSTFEKNHHDIISMHYQNNNTMTNSIIIDKNNNKITFYTFKEKREFDLKSTTWTKVIDFISWFDILTSKY